MCLGEKKIAIVLQIKKSDNWFRFAHLQPTKTRRTTTITALDLPNLNDLKIFYSLQDLSPTTGGPVLNEGDNEGDFDDLLPGNIVVGLRPGPTKPRTQTRAQPLSLMPRMPWMIQSFLLADFLQRKRMRTTLMICCWETLLLAWNWVQPTSHKHELNRYNWCQGCLGPSSWLLFFQRMKMKAGPTNPTTSTSKTAIIDAKYVLDDPDLPPVPLFLEKENEDDFDLQSPVAEILGLRPTAK